MKQNRADRVIAELKKQGVTQMLITDPMSVYYLTDVYVQPMERFYALLLKENGDHIFFLYRKSPEYSRYGLTIPIR